MSDTPSSPVTTPDSGSMLEVAYHQVDEAAQILGLDPQTRDRFLAPERVIDSWIEDPRSGRSVIRAMRVQHSTEQGPSKGGIRMAESVDRSEVGALALFMTLKTATADLPLGGAKGGVVVSASDLSEEQRSEVFGSIAERWAPIIGSDIDVLGPDVGTGQNEMDALHTAWRDVTGRTSGTPSTGKAEANGGLAFRTGATARGLDLILDELRERLGLGESFRFAVHGYGSVGRGIAERLTDRGHTLVAISDSGGGAHDPDGLDLSDLDDRRYSDGSVSDGSTRSIDVLTVDCDLLIPAALQGVIDASIAQSVGAGVILEGANGPCTWEGITTLRERGITAIPDVLANSGGVSVSYEEMTEPAERDPEDVIAKRFDERMRSAANSVWSAADDNQTDLRTGATIGALRRVLG